MTKSTNKIDTRDLTIRLMGTIGLEIDGKNNVVDQDTGVQLAFNSKSLKLPTDENERVGRGEASFDPIGNGRLMSNLLSYYNDKLVYEGEASPISVFYTLTPDEEGRSSMELKNEDNEVLRSKAYKSDSLKIMDLLFQIGGDDDVDLSIYDNIEQTRPTKTNNKQGRKRN